MTAEEEQAFRRAVREIIAEWSPGTRGELIIRSPDDDDARALFSVVRFADGKRGILVPGHLVVDEAAADEHFTSLIRQEVAAACARRLN